MGNVELDCLERKSTSNLRIYPVSSTPLNLKMGDNMKAVHYEGPFKVSVKEVPKPILQHPDDAIIKVTTSAICGSDLHMYQGRTAAESGLIFGHENMGIVEEIGEGVTLL